MRVGVSLLEAGRLGAGSRIDVRTHPPTISAVEYELSPWARDDVLACGPVVLVSERLALRLEEVGIRGGELVPATILPERPGAEEWTDEPLPSDAPTRYRWIRESGNDDADVRVVHPEYLEVSERVAELLRAAELPNAVVDVPADDVNGPRSGMTVAVPRAFIHGTHGPRGFDGLPTVEAFLETDHGEQAEFASVTDAIAWAQACVTQVLVHLGDGSWSAGSEPFPGFAPLPDEALRAADAQALAHREQGLAELLVHPEPRPWFTTIVAPDTTLPLDEAERRVRLLDGVDDLSRHETAGGDVLWLIVTQARGPDDVDALEFRIGEVLLTPDRFAHLQDGDTFSYSTGRGGESGLLEHLDLEGLLAGWVGRMGRER